MDCGGWGAFSSPVESQRGAAPGIDVTGSRPVDIYGRCRPINPILILLVITHALLHVILLVTAPVILLVIPIFNASFNIARISAARPAYPLQGRAHTPYI